MPVRMPKSTTVATAVALTVGYANKGSVVDVRGYGDLTLHVTAAGTGHTVLKVYADPVSTTTPADADAANMHQVMKPGDVAGAEWEITVNTGEKLSIPMPGLSANFLAFKAKYSATDGTATVILTGIAESGGSTQQV